MHIYIYLRDINVPLLRCSQFTAFRCIIKSQPNLSFRSKKTSKQTNNHVDSCRLWLHFGGLPQFSFPSSRVCVAVAASLVTAAWQDHLLWQQLLCTLHPVSVTPATRRFIIVINNLQLAVVTVCQISACCRLFVFASPPLGPLVLDCSTQSTHVFFIVHVFSICKNLLNDWKIFRNVSLFI